MPSRSWLPGRPSMAEMPGTSMAHMAQVTGLPAQVTRIAVAAGENG